MFITRGGPFKNQTDGEKRRMTAKDTKRRRKTANNIVIMKYVSKLVN